MRKVVAPLFLPMVSIVRLSHYVDLFNINNDIKVQYLYDIYMLLYYSICISQIPICKKISLVQAILLIWRKRPDKIMKRGDYSQKPCNLHYILALTKKFAWLKSTFDLPFILWNGCQMRRPSNETNLLMYSARIRKKQTDKKLSFLMIIFWTNLKAICWYCQIINNI